VAAARLGRRAGVITKVGDDPFGDYILKALEGFDVDGSRVSAHPGLRTPLAFCEIHPPDRFPLLFYREPKAPDLELSDNDVDLAEIASVPVFWTTGTGLSQEPSRSTTLAALRARKRAAHTVHDLDYRASFWQSGAEAGRWNREALAWATVAVGNRDEVAIVTADELSPERSARALLELGPALAIVKLGGDGVLAAAKDGEILVPGVDVEVLNGLGAGDAFGGALCHGLLSGWELERTVRFANAAGAYVATKLGCSDDMPSVAEVQSLLWKA
jgi:5-dehydro-2-deoxygluconokinase